MLLTILMSFVVRVGFGHRVSVGEVYSDDHSSPKNAIDTAAHNIFVRGVMFTNVSEKGNHLSSSNGESARPRPG